MSVLVAFIKLSFVRVASLFDDYAVAMIDLIFPLARVSVTVLVNYFALPMFLVIEHLAFVAFALDRACLEVALH